MRAGKRGARFRYLMVLWLCVVGSGMTELGCDGPGKGSGLGSGGRGGTSLAASGGQSGLGGGAGQPGGGGQASGAGGLGLNVGGALGGSSGTVDSGGSAGSQTSGGASGAVGGTGGAGGASTIGSSDGGADSVCVPDCWRRMHAGCFPEGTCTYVPGRFCWSNGFKMASGYYDGAAGQAFFQDGSLCAIQQFSGNGYTYYDAKGTILGVQKGFSDGSFTVTCTGESTVTVPADCPGFLYGCYYGDCTVP